MWEMGCIVENNPSPTTPATILHFWTDLTLVNLKHGRRGQVLHESVQGVYPLPNIINDGSYIEIHEMCGEIGFQ